MLGVVLDNEYVRVSFLEFQKSAVVERERETSAGTGEGLDVGEILR
jgi:hypothetical protein